ncbi:hypothetical protein [Thalassotalea ganghwensis]
MKSLTTFVEYYIDNFKCLDIEALSGCYQFPCTLSTPDELMLLTNEKELLAQFSDIRQQVQQADVNCITCSNISFSKVCENITLLGMTWLLQTASGQVLSHFFACYHLVTINEHYRIFNVVSQEAEKAVVLSTAITFDKEQ